MITIAVYTRSATVSPESIETQRRTINDALEQAGFMKEAAIEYYSDDGASGLNIERPGLLRLLADVAKGKFQWLVVDEWFRLSRSEDLLGILDKLLAHNVACVTARELEALC